METFLKIDRRRELPAYESPTFRQWFREHRLQGAIEKIAYFYGCYTNTNEVDVGKARLRSSRQTVSRSSFLPRDAAASRCSGMEISRGQGRWGCEMSLLFSRPSVRASTIVFSSTSCGHMIKHEYSRLLNIPGSEELAPHLFDLFEFLRNLKEVGSPSMPTSRNFP